jgi:hypothetical protein
MNHPHIRPPRGQGPGQSQGPGMRAALVLLGWLLQAAACAPAPTRNTDQGSARAVLLEGGRRGPRLGWVAWGAKGALIACGRRAASAADAGSPERCLRIEGPGATPEEVPPGELDAGRRDTTPAEWAPGGCRVLLEDSRDAGPARASLVGPRGRVTVGEWQPAPNVGGDVYSLETSFSADGRHLALLRLSVGVGDDGILVELKDAEVRAAPPCR